jgi:hypothetical protein
MGIALDIYRLYRWRGDQQERLVLAKATRPEFPNWSQPAEDAADHEVDVRFSAMLVEEGRGLVGGSVELLAVWEGGHPEGDIFYEGTSGVELDVWLVFDTVHKGYFVFGGQADEASFWTWLQDVSESGEVCELSAYPRPAHRVKVLFIQ